MENKIVLAGSKKYPDVHIIEDIKNELVRKHEIDVCIDYEDEKEPFYNDVYLYSNFIPPNIDKNIFDFLTMTTYLKSNMAYNKLITIIPYLEYDFNIYKRGFYDYLRSKTFSDLINKSGINKIITINNEMFPVDILHKIRYGVNIYNINILRHIFKDVCFQPFKTGIFLTPGDHGKCSNYHQFETSYFLNTFRENYQMEKITDIQDKCFVLYLTILKDVDIVNNIINYLKSNGCPFPIEIITLGIYPSDDVVELLKNEFIEKVFSSDIIPLTKELQELNKIVINPIYDKISDKISEIVKK